MAQRQTNFDVKKVGELYHYIETVTEIMTAEECKIKLQGLREEILKQQTEESQARLAIETNALENQALLARRKKEALTDFETYWKDLLNEEPMQTMK